MTKIEPPRERACERCGRREVWDVGRQVWRALEEDGDRKVGRAHCLHEWDINGTYSPIADA
ncbi:HEWD family protein [Halorhabdus salina]|uniref:HEWD family protein n=1 Tax=Halorhabdus salina TaxID=2750670 RepID=UPI0015EFCC55|nr:HEWD family protein [Halorhabdus salina]